VLQCVYNGLQCIAVRCSVLQCVAACCSVLLQCVAEDRGEKAEVIEIKNTVCIGVVVHKASPDEGCIDHPWHKRERAQCVAVSCSVSQCVAVCCSVLQCVAVRFSVLQCVAVCCSKLQCVSVHKASPDEGYIDFPWH